MERPLALITGASSGIGYELARVFAENGFDLIIVARGDGLLQARSDLEVIGAKVQAIQEDLANARGVEALCHLIIQGKRPLEAIAINAGVTVGGSFLETDFKDEINLINLNILSAIHLTKRLLPMMVKEKRGRLLFTSSLSANIPGPYQAVYSASKAFLLSFAEGIREELRESGVTVTVLMPGATDTELFEKGGMEDTLLGSYLKHENDPEKVARQGFEAMMAGKDIVFAESIATKVLGMASRWIPENWKARAHRFISEPGSVRH